MTAEEHTGKVWTCKCESCFTFRRERRRELEKLQVASNPNYHRECYRKKINKPGAKEKERKRSNAKTKKTNIAHKIRLAEMKLNKGCVDCGYRDHHAALDFDHVNGIKFKQVALMAGHTAVKIDQEIAKCEIRCFRCHRIATKRRFKSGESVWASKRTSFTRSQIRTHKIRDHRREYLAGVKTKLGCVDCGYCEKSEALDFDHVRGIKLFSPSEGVSKRMEVLEDEIAKCEVVCANCHRVRTFNRYRNRKGVESSH